MVTTRRQSGEQADDRSNNAQITHGATPSSSRKRQIPSIDAGDSELIRDEETKSPASKKQKVLPTRAKPNKTDQRQTLVTVEIPVRSDGAVLDSYSKRQPQGEVAISEAMDATEESTLQQERVEIPDSDSDGEDSENKDVRNDSITAHKEEATLVTVRAAPKVKHKRFDSQEPEVITAPAADEHGDPNDEGSEDESSDDEAPEVVGAQDAQEQARKKKLDAAKAVKE